LALLGWAAMPGCVPGAVSVSLSCDDDAGPLPWAEGFACPLSLCVAEGAPSKAMRGARRRRRRGGLVAQLVRAHA